MCKYVISVNVVFSTNCFLLKRLGSSGLLPGSRRCREAWATLTPLPYPAAKAVLHETGAYRVVHHPINCGVIIAAFGWALVNHGWLTTTYVVAGFVFLDVKVGLEEKWLVERFPAYTAYQRRGRKLIPFVY